MITVTVKKGMVISQTVTPGGKAAAGTTISITVSNGPKPEEKIDIQSFVGQQESALKSWASQNGLYTNVSELTETAAVMQKDVSSP